MGELYHRLELEVYVPTLELSQSRARALLVDLVDYDPRIRFARITGYSEVELQGRAGPDDVVEAHVVVPGRPHILENHWYVYHKASGAVVVDQAPTGYRNVQEARRFIAQASKPDELGTIPGDAVDV